MTAKTPKGVVCDRVEAVIDRLDVAMQFSTVDTAICSQTMHALTYALTGPPERTDEDYLAIEPNQAIALVHALLPFVRAARRRPPPEMECGELVATSCGVEITCDLPAGHDGGADRGGS